MADSVQRLDVFHEALFSKPEFRLMREFAPITKIFYETLAARFSLSTAHTTVNSTNTFGDLSIRIGMFNNAASVELMPDKMSARLPNITNAEGIIISKDTIALSHTALATAMPETTLRASNFTLSIWIAMEGGAVAADELLLKYTTPASPLDASKWGASASRHGMRFLTRNDAEGWAITLFGDPSLVPGSHLFLSIDISFSRSGLLPIGEQIAFAELRLPQIFGTLGVKFPDEVIINAQ